jgi:hypothetical protein
MTVMANWITCAEDKDTLTLGFRAPLDHVTQFKDTLTLRFRALAREEP